MKKLILIGAMLIGSNAYSFSCRTAPKVSGCISEAALDNLVSAAVNGDSATFARLHTTGQCRYFEKPRKAFLTSGGGWTFRAVRIDGIRYMFASEHVPCK